MCSSMCRCHRELHEGVVYLPDNIPSFDDAFVAYKQPPDIFDPEPCPVCGGRRKKNQITCSSVCAGKRIRKIDWDIVDLEILLQSNNPEQIGAILGCSGAAVRKRIKRHATII